MRSRTRLLMILAVLAIAAALLPAIHAEAATITVTTRDDYRSSEQVINGSLRDAVNRAAAGDTIQFSPDLTRPVIIPLVEPLTISKSLIIDGGPSVNDPITIYGHDSFRAFEVTNASLSLNNLTLTNCKAPSNEVGGAINFTSPTATDAVLSLSNCRITNNEGQQHGGGIYCEGAASVTCSQCLFMNNSVNVNDIVTRGGGLYATGTSGNVTLTGCSFLNNFSHSTGAALTCQDSNTTMTNCTFSGNQCAAYGVAYIEDSNLTAGDSLTVVNCTFTGNTGGFYIHYINQVTFLNDIFWDEYPYGTNGGGSPNISNCIIKNCTPGYTLSNQNPLLGTYGSYGGAVGTIPLLPGSPAIDAGSSSIAAGVPPTDARGAMRYNGVDIGAFESQGFTLTPEAGSTPQYAAINTAYSSPLSIIVDPKVAGEPVAGGVVTFTAPASGASAGLSAATAQIIEHFTPVSVTATANGTVGGYNVTASVSSSDITNFALFNTGSGSADHDITGFSFAAQTGPATINTSAHTVAITVQNVSPTNLTPTIAVSPGASIDPASGVTCDFSDPVTYTVTAENGFPQVWTVTVSVSGPDLALDTIDPPTEAAAGTKVTLNIKVINIGETEAAKSTLTIDWDGQLLATKSVSKLKVKQSKIIKVRVAIPAVHGAGWIAVRAIPSGPDKDLQNNMVAIPVKVVAPDLTITSFAPKGTLVPGKTGTMTMTIENLTIAKAPKFDVIIGYGQTVLATKKITSLKQGTKTLNIRFKVPIDYVNTNPLVGVVDPYNTVVEENENNNWMLYPIGPG
ncbi:MAG: CARDB domain-containing protein [Chitinophagales bacterium]